MGLEHEAAHFKSEHVQECLCGLVHSFQLSINLRIVPSARADIHNLFDERRWLMVPENSVLEIFSKSLVQSVGNRYYAQREKFPEFLVCPYFESLRFSNW
jgi:hypothetical protein